MPITDTAIRQSKPAAKPYKLYDSHGLFLMVNPTGSRLWRWRYKFEGKEKLMALGEYPVQTLADARQLQLAQRKVLASGVDPMVERKTTAESKQLADGVLSFEMVAKQWWEWWGKGKAQKHVDTVWHRLEGDVFPAYGRKAISAVSAADVREVMLVIASRGANDLAKRARETTSQIFRYAIAHGLAERNPAMDFLPGDILQEVAVKHQPRVEESELPGLLAAIDGYTGEAVTRYAMRLMALTFLRTSELIKASWSEIDLAAHRWDIPGPRMKMKKPHIVPLAPQTVTLLKELKKLTGKGGLVFPGDHKGEPISTNTVLFALYRLGYKGKMTGHGFRGVASTILNEHDFDPAHIEMQLAHVKQDKVAAAYNNAKFMRQRALLMAWWADYLDSALAKGLDAAHA